jgi:hypothetical protein
MSAIHDLPRPSLHTIAESFQSPPGEPYLSVVNEDVMVIEERGDWLCV